MQRCNLIVPVVGDFSGNKTLRSIAGYVRSHMGIISVFYTSNVELYLHTSTDLDTPLRFHENIASMPINESSVFIRSYANDLFVNLLSHPNRIGNHSFTTHIQSISCFIEDGTWQTLRGYNRYIHIVKTCNVD